MNKNKEIKQDEILDDKNDLVGDEMLDKDEYIAKLNDDLNEQKKKTDEYFEHLKRNMAEFDRWDPGNLPVCPQRPVPGHPGTKYGNSRRLPPAFLPAVCQSPPCQAQGLCGTISLRYPFPILPYGSIFWYGYYSTKILIKKVILHPAFLHQL